MTSARLYDTLRTLDEVVAKVLGVREVARIARTETLMRRFLAAEWDRIARRAAKAAAAAVRRGHARLTPDDIKNVGKAVDRVMARWAPRVTKRFVDDTERIYRLGRIAALKKGTGRTRASLSYTSPVYAARERTQEALRKQKQPALEVAFDLEDERAVEMLRKQQTFWVGHHYSRNVSRVVRTVARETIVEQGYGRAAAGNVMEKAVRGALKTFTTPTGWTGVDKLYFEMLAANAATTARVQGQLKSFSDLGFTEYIWTNPNDRRTCFFPSVPVLLADGTWKPIGEIQPGEFVVTRRGRARRVTAAFRRQAHLWAHVSFDDGVTLTCTHDHRLADAAGGWIEAWRAGGSGIERLAPQGKLALRDLRPSIQQAKKPSKWEAPLLHTGVSFGDASISAGESSMRDLRSAVQQAAEPGEEKAPLLLRRVRQRGAGASESSPTGLSLQSLRPGVCAASSPSGSDLLLGRVCAQGVGRCRCAEELSSLRSLVRGLRKCFASIRQLLTRVLVGAQAEGLLAGAADQGLRSLREVVSHQASRGEGEQAPALLFSLLPAQRKAVWSGAGCTEAAGLAGARLPAGGEDRTLGCRLPHRQGGRGSRRDVLALQVGGEVARRAQGSSPAPVGLSGGPPSRSRDRERSGSSPRVVGWSSRVVDVRLSEFDAPACDIEVEEDHSFVVWPGVAVHNCKRCAHLDGKKFQVADGRRQVEAELAAKRPDDIRVIHPWKTLSQLVAISPSAGHVSRADSRALAAAGVSLAPIHGL